MMKSNLERLTEEVFEALEKFTSSFELPQPIIIDSNKGMYIEFDFESAADDYDCVLLNPTGMGLQVHEYYNDKPFSYTNDEDELHGGWVVSKTGTLRETAEGVALQICADFDLS